MDEDAFLALLRSLPLHPGAAGLVDDAATLGGQVITTDTLVEGVHFLAGDAPGDVAWKLLAVNLSDLAAKGAAPAGVLLNYPLSDPAWDATFIAGLGEALAAMGTVLVGGDTVSLPPGAPRVLTLTAFGHAPAVVPRRTGAQPGDVLWVAGTIGDAGAGLALAQAGLSEPASLLAAYHRPRPLLAEGQALAPHVHAMMDVSDGLLIDAARMAAASSLAVSVELAAMPLSADFRSHRGDDRAARLFAATAGDDYALLFAAPPFVVPPISATRIGQFATGSGLVLLDGDTLLPLPASLGWRHGG